ncbi:gluconate:H+ symporter [Shouchella clausii]|jgi:gluconate:H+ symporter, GntP family|uniref:H+:gluconate symporter n=2 Tax=Shouchella TaxID=2893057 RepID=Q5WJ76_SHOC1|nr:MULTISPECIES: gluconate:H+ symporter [Shouchella]MCM3311734.1 gluconate:H+ symporter [Psychrobacillus sp. MER TA 17]ALA51774.1 Gluconate permease [Shouchella clausii]KKI87217.1 gluconate permease [Shouchella clausii]MBU3232189.1 gluconate:H+ symporter [Shouchella clausii]MBU3264479.1 gluconate:H+ symporter [Shouchella clausii]
MPLLITAVGVLVLLLLIMKWKVNTFISLAIVTFLLAIALGIPLSDIVGSIERGLGGTLASVGLIFGFGAILGKLIADGGGAQRISTTLIDAFGEKRIQWAVVLTAFILGIALFFEVGLVLLIPIVYQISKQVNLSFLYLGLPMATALSVTHAFLPPHPGPTVIAGEFGANIGMVLLYGFIISIPTVLIAGPLFTKYARKFVPDAFEKANKGGMAALGDSKPMPLEDTPGFAKSALTALFPVLLMGIATVTSLLQEAANLPDHWLFHVVAFIGMPTSTMFLSLLLALYTMGISQKRTMAQLMESAEQSVKAIAMILLILGISGSLKEVLIVGGVGDYVASLFIDSALSPLVLAWLIAALMRLAQGSATVAALTTAGLVIPLMEGSDVNVALMVLATGAGSIIASHVNDTGFWIVKESFGLTMKETFATWTVLETIISVCGLLFVFILSIFV